MVEQVCKIVNGTHWRPILLQQLALNGHMKNRWIFVSSVPLSQSTQERLGSSSY
jgi:hypothetical protein